MGNPRRLLPRLPLRRLLLPTLLLGLVAAWVVGGLVVTSLGTARAQDTLRADLEGADWPSPAATPRRMPPVGPVASPAETGDPLATLEIPRFGSEWSWVVVEGTQDEQLDDGPGHYSGTPRPGAVGNVGIAAHRAGHGSPFIDFDELRIGDEVRVGQGDVVWVYRLTSAPAVIANDDHWVLDPLPGRKLTLTTCWPKYGSLKRMYVQAELDRTERPQR